MSRRVVVTGVGAVTPLGVGADALLRRWVAGEVGIRDGVARCEELDPTAVLSVKEARRTDRFAQLALVASVQALAGAGWPEGETPCEPERVACVIGTGIGGLSTILDQHDVLRLRGENMVSPLLVPLMIPNAGAGTVAMRHGLRGPSFGVTSACAAGAHALGCALRMIQSGDADAAVAGGAEAAINPLTCAGFMAMGAMSETGISRPFDARRDGFVMGEGAGVLVLEEAEMAERRGAPILGEVLGYGASSDAHHPTMPEPGGAGAARAIRGALADAGISPERVDYVNAHGTSTRLNDRAETEALKSALGAYAAKVPVSSVKSAIGHLLGAAGAVEAIVTLLALRARVAPPTLGYVVPEEGLDLDYVPARPKPLPVADRRPGPSPVADRRTGPSPVADQRTGPSPTTWISSEPGSSRAVGLSNSFGFGGHNAVLVLAA